MGAASHCSWMPRSISGTSALAPRHDERRSTHPQARLGLTPIRPWNDDDFDVLSDGIVVGRIMNAATAPVGSSWLWAYGFDPRERQPAHGYCTTREAAMAAFAKSWRRE